MIGSIFVKIRDEIEEIFTDAEKEVVDFVEALATTISQNGGSVLINAAIAAVTAAESATGTASDKFAAAVSDVEGVLKTQGLPVLKNAVYGAVEAAVAQLRTTQPGAGTIASNADTNSDAMENSVTGSAS